MMKRFGVACLAVLSVATCACASAPVSGSEARGLARDSRYPAYWWDDRYFVEQAEIPVKYPADGSKFAWEVMPSEAGEGEVILSKRNELGLLSNFAATPFTYKGKRYASVEGFWQMMHYPEGPAGDPKDPRNAPGVTWKYTREQVGRMVALEAKIAGDLAEKNLKKLGIDWVSFEGKRFPYRLAPGEHGDHFRLIVEAMQAKLEQNPKVREVLSRTGGLKLRPDHHPEEAAPDEWNYFDLWMQMRSQL